MLTLTEAAGAHLAEILTDRDCPDDMAVRLVCEQAGSSLILDNKKEGDTTVEHQGRTVLLLDQTAAELLEGETMDVKDTAEGEQLYLAGKGPESP